MSDDLSFCTVAWIEAGQRELALRMEDGSVRMAKLHDSYVPSVGDRLRGNFANAGQTTATKLGPPAAVCLTVCQAATGANAAVPRLM